MYFKKGNKQANGRSRIIMCRLVTEYALYGRTTKKERRELNAKQIKKQDK